MGTKQFDSATDLITFTRASGGTALRKISYGSELVTNGTFDTDTSGWTGRVATNTLISNISQALRVTASSTAGVPWAYQSFTTEVGKVYLFSIESKGGTATGALYKIGTAEYGTQNASGSLSGVVTGTFVATSTTTFMTIEPTLSSYSGSEAGDYWDFDNISVKEVVLDVATDPLVLYNHSNNTPRIEYNADGTVKGLLIEEARTNLAIYSQEFDNTTGWTAVTGMTPSATTDTEAPDGSNDAYKLTGDGVAGTAKYIIHTMNASADIYWQHTCFFKKDTNSFVQLAVGGISSIYANFDLNNGIKGSIGTYAGLTSNMTPLGNGWYRCNMGFNIPSSSKNLIPIITLVDSATAPRIQSNSLSTSVFVWGMQVEEGAFPTSYIPTTGSTATRAADVATIPTSAFGYNSDAGSVAVEWTQPTWGGYVTMLSDNTAANRSIINQFTNGLVYFSTITNNVAQGDILSGTSVEGEYNKAATTIQFNNAAVSLNGAASIVDTTYVVPNVTNLSLGSYTVGGSTYLNGHIKSIKYYPRRLSNAQLQELTT